MQLFAARELCISLIFLIYLPTSFGQTNSILIDKIRQLNTGKLILRQIIQFDYLLLIK